MPMTLRRKSIAVSLLSLVSLLWPPGAGAVDFTEFGPSGGPGGTQFMDCASVTTNGAPAHPVAIQVRSGDFIDAVRVVYSGEQVSGPFHGGPGGNLSTFRLDPDEYIVAMGGKYGKFVDSLFIRTNKGRSQKWGGTGGTADFYYATPSGLWISGLWGRSGLYVDAVGACVAKTN